MNKCLMNSGYCSVAFPKHFLDELKLMIFLFPCRSHVLNLSLDARNEPIQGPPDAWGPGVSPTGMSGAALGEPRGEPTPSLLGAAVTRDGGTANAAHSGESDKEPWHVSQHN